MGKRIVIVEDVTTTGGSAIKAAEAVRDAGGDIVMVFTMVDRQEGATEGFQEAKLPFRSLYTADEFLKVEVTARIRVVSVTQRLRTACSLHNLR